MGTTSQDSAYHQWLARLTQHELESRLRALGVEKVVLKRLADRQDNTKNQIYWQGNLNENPLPKHPFEAFQSGSSKGGGGQTGYRARLDFEWLTPTGTNPAPHAQLIHYPQYPETRLGSLLTGADLAPRSILGSREASVPGRLLLLATAGAKVIGVALPPDAPATGSLGHLIGKGPFATWNLAPQAQSISAQDLLSELSGVHELGRVAGCSIAKGVVVRNTNPNSPGTTLETILGVKPNSRDEPDFHGWELKSYRASRVTLMTPAPTGGAIVTEAPEDFMRMFGWINDAGTRWDFNGAHRAGHPPTGRASTRLHVSTDQVQLLEANTGTVAMSWQIADLLTHWSLKHSRAAYIRRGGSADGFTFGPHVQLGEGIDWKWFLQAIENGTIVADPAYNMPVGGRSMRKARSQFRCYPYELGALYPSVTVHDLRHTGPTRTRAQANLRAGRLEVPAWVCASTQTPITKPDYSFEPAAPGQRMVVASQHDEERSEGSTADEIPTLWS